MKTDLLLTMVLLLISNASWLAATCVKEEQRLFILIASFCGGSAFFRILPYLFE